jgi:CheY-like chemotaxis protein
MATGSKTLLCIDRDPAELRLQRRLLRRNGYRVVTATNGHDGLRAFAMAEVDAIVLGYYLALLDGAAVAAAMKQVKPKVPIVMLADGLELPEGIFQTVDALVTKSDGPRFLLLTLQSVLEADRTLSATDAEETVPKEDRRHDGRRALEDLRALIDSFALETRRHVVREIRTVLEALALPSCAPELNRKAPDSLHPDRDFRPYTLPPTGSASR